MVVVAAVLRATCLDFHTVPNEPSDLRNWANSPNLEPGDLALVLRIGSPHVGELVRCPDPSDPSRWLVGRIAGTAGDQVQLADGELRLNRFRVKTATCLHEGRSVPDDQGATAEASCWSEEVGISRHDVSVVPGHSPTYGEVTVPEGFVFLLSDQRSEPWSHDSRNDQVGLLPAAGCTERLVLRLWSARGWSDASRRLTPLN